MAERDDPRAALQPLDVETNLRAANQRLRRDLATARDALRRAELERDVARAGLAAAIPLLDQASIGEVRAAMLLHQPRPRILADQQPETARALRLDVGPDRQRQTWRHNPRTGQWEIDQPDCAVFIGPVGEPPDPHPERGNWTHIGWLSPGGGVSFTTSKTGTTGEGPGATAAQARVGADGTAAAMGPLPTAPGAQLAGGPAADGPLRLEPSGPAPGDPGARQGDRERPGDAGAS